MRGERRERVCVCLKKAEGVGVVCVYSWKEGGGKRFGRVCVAVCVWGSESISVLHLFINFNLPFSSFSPAILPFLFLYIFLYLIPPLRLFIVLSFLSSHILALYSTFHYILFSSRLNPRLFPSVLSNASPSPVPFLLFFFLLLLLSSLLSSLCL